MKSKFITYLTKPNLLSRIKNKVSSYFFLDQWIILIASNTGYKSLSWEEFTPLTPPPDRFWADPFIWMHEDIYYIFIEEVFYSTNRGHITCLKLDKKMNILTRQIVLERPYHLSYPFLFEYEKKLYMLPETRKNNTIELYRCKHFPDQWVFEKILINNIQAVDGTLIQVKDKWWLFANIKEEGRGSSWDTLHLYYADHPLSDQWNPHPLNPIVKDIQSARPAGRIFLANGALIRPSQDCSIRYGYAINFNRIINLTETDYTEIREYTFKPTEKSGLLATHTFNQTNSLTAIDAIKRRSKFS